MTKKADFTEQEWRILGLAVACVGIAVSKAEHSGIAGQAAEQDVTGEGRALLAYDNFAENEFIIALGETPETDFGAFILPGSDERRTKDLAYWRDETLSACRDAVDMLTAKSDAAALEAYRRYVIDLGWRVAYAGRHAEVFGIGLGAASDEEVALMREIADALGVDPNTAEPPATASN